MKTVSPPPQKTSARAATAVPTPAAPALHPALELQRAVGNQAVQDLLRRGAIRAKLTMGSPDSAPEREADRVADQVVRAGDQRPAPAPCPCMAAGGELCGECRQKLGATVQRQAAPGGMASPAGLRTVGGVLRSPGQRLDPAARGFFEPRFGRSFGEVRVHTDRDAAASARSVNALAYTAGQHIVFGAGQYAPDSREGRRLLAHELTHTIQQGHGDSTVQRQEAPADAGAAKVNPLPVPGGPLEVVKDVDGIPLVEDDATIRAQFQMLLANGGKDRLYRFVNALRDDCATDEMAGERPAAGIPEDYEEKFGAYDATKAKERRVLERVEAILKELEDFLVQFENQARDVAGKILKESWDHVLAEAVRYGVTNVHIEFSKWLGVPELKGEVADNASTRGIALAARGLLDRKRPADKAVSDYKEKTSGAPAFAELAAERWHTSDKDELDGMREVIRRTQRELDVYRIQVQARYPLLAALSSDEDFHFDDLENLAKGSKGPNSDAGDVIVAQVFEKLTNIAKVESELKPGGDVNVWRTPKLVDATRTELAAPPGSLKGLMVDEKVKSEQPGVLTGLLIGLLQLGLVLLAPFTGGLTLIPAAAISVGVAYQHYREYEIGKALHGTDFGAAALSAEDPSLFWLAVDIVGAGFDVVAGGGAALRIFRQLSTAAKALRAGEVTETAVRALERQAAELGGEALAKQVGKDARAIQREAVGITAEEAGKFEQAAIDVFEKEVKEGAAKAATLAGGEVKVSPSGSIFSCSSPCAMMRERFREMLVREPKYGAQLEALEARSHALPVGPEGDVARQQIATEAAALEREMRTTALPGDWTSPLKESPDFNKLVERRGTVAAELDTHPPNWTGRDEARFRYGSAAEPEPGYRWLMEEDGGLRYDRMPNNQGALRRFNPATELFEDAAEAELIRAVKGVEEAHPLAGLPQQERDAMEAAFQKRRDFIKERDDLESIYGPLRREDSERLSKLYGAINEESRQLGEQAAEGVMKSKGAGKRVYPLEAKPSTSGDFDQVWKNGEEFALVEAKGGSSGLGSRKIEEGGLRAEQGTSRYAEAIADNMERNGATKEIRQLGTQLREAIAKGKVKYYLVRAPVETKGGVSVLGDVKFSEFAL